MIVVDASTLVSAALKVDSTPAQALLRAEEVDIFALSTAVDAEIADVLSRPNSQALFRANVGSTCWSSYAVRPSGSIPPCV